MEILGLRNQHQIARLAHGHTVDGDAVHRAETAGTKTLDCRCLIVTPARDDHQLSVLHRRQFIASIIGIDKGPVVVKSQPRHRCADRPGLVAIEIPGHDVIRVIQGRGIIDIFVQLPKAYVQAGHGLDVHDHGFAESGRLQRRSVRQAASQLTAHPVGLARRHRRRADQGRRQTRREIGFDWPAGTGQGVQVPGRSQRQRDIRPFVQRECQALRAVTVGDPGWLAGPRGPWNQGQTIGPLPASSPGAQDALQQGLPGVACKRVCAVREIRTVLRP